MRTIVTVILFLGAIVLLVPAETIAEGSLAKIQPTFHETGHVPPDPAVPAPRALSLEYLDMLVLLAALSVASYLALRARSRRGLMLLSVFCLLYFGFWRQGCICPVGAVQNVMQALTDRTYVIPLVVVVFFSLPLIFTLFFGRTFCAAVCPLGAIQDVALLRPVRIPIWISNVLGLLPHLYLALSLTLVYAGAGYLICRYDPFVGFFRLSASFPMLLFGGTTLLLSMFVGRPYCRFLCPYGVLLNGCSRLARRHVTITPNDCVECRLCEASCPFDAILVPTPDKAPDTRARGVRRLSWILLLIPVLTAGGAFLGSRMAVPLSRLDDTVQLAERLHLEESGVIQEASVETEGYRRTKESPHLLYRKALRVRGRLATGGWYLGGFMGLMIGVRLLSLSVWRRRHGYVPHRGECFSCARCYRYCPKETERLKKREGKR
jgi:NosR/NirI family nitrous oxide reductase transcriptional regulator